MRRCDALLIDKRVLFFGGKGGVGKTTCASAMALAASQAGKRVLLVSTDPAHSTSDMFERPIGPEPVQLLPNLHGLEIDGAFESQRYVANVKEQINGLFGHHILKEATRQIDLAASMPGAEEMALFDRIGGLIRGEDDRFDLIVFDTAPTGHTLRLIRMPELMEAWIRALSRSRRAMLGIEQDDATDPVMMSLARAAREPARVPRPAAQPAHQRVRAGAGRRAAADRGNRARDRAARGSRRHDRRHGRQSRAAGDQSRSVPALASRAGTDLPRRDRSAVQSSTRACACRNCRQTFTASRRSSISPSSSTAEKALH